MRHYTKRVDMRACRLSKDDLKRLYRIVNEKQTEVGKAVLSHLFQTEKETTEEFQSRCVNVENVFVTTVRISGFNGEIVTGHGEVFFEADGCSWDSG
jgi:hypothetical protein